MADVIAKRYSRALFDLAEEKGLLEQTERDARFVLNLMEEHPELYRYLGLPDVPVERKQHSMERILKESVGRPVMGLVYLLIEKSRIGYMKEVFEGYFDLLMEYRRQIRVQITSAAELSGEQTGRILETLEKTLQKEVLPEIQIDPDLIGGLIVRVGDVVYDNSIRSSMNRMTLHLENLRIADGEKGGVAQA